MQFMKSQQVTEEDILEEFLNEYYREENFKRKLKENQEEKDIKNFKCSL